jgi:hypothetical protein
VPSSLPVPLTIRRHLLAHWPGCATEWRSGDGLANARAVVAWAIQRYWALGYNGAPPPFIHARSRLRDAVQNVTRVTHAPAGFGKLVTNRDIAGQGWLRPCVTNSLMSTCQGPHFAQAALKSCRSLEERLDLAACPEGATRTVLLPIF